MQNSSLFSNKEDITFKRIPFEPPTGRNREKGKKQKKLSIQLEMFKWNYDKIKIIRSHNFSFVDPFVLVRSTISNVLLLRKDKARNTFAHLLGFAIQIGSWSINMDR